MVPQFRPSWRVLAEDCGNHLDKEIHPKQAETVTAAFSTWSGAQSSTHPTHIPLCPFHIRIFLIRFGKQLMFYVCIITCRPPFMSISLFFYGWQCMLSLLCIILVTFYVIRMLTVTAFCHVFQPSTHPLLITKPHVQLRTLLIMQHYWLYTV